jgi:hypothetical protein
MMENEGQAIADVAESAEFMEGLAGKCTVLRASATNFKILYWALRNQALTDALRTGLTACLDKRGKKDRAAHHVIGEILIPQGSLLP